jgi:hypothetical protein
MTLITLVFMACNGYNDAEVANIRKVLAVAHDAVQQVHIQ